VIHDLNNIFTNIKQIDRVTLLLHISLDSLFPKYLKIH